MNRRTCVNFLVLFLYIGAVLLVSWRHEPWADEAQAWLIARDSDYRNLLLKVLRYEGSPGLWHLLLTIPAKLGGSYWSMKIVSAGAGATAVAVLLWRSPWPLWLRASVPFSYFIFYQYAVVARSYALLAPILFLLAAGFRDRFKSPLRHHALLTLLSHTCLHGLVIAACWELLDLAEVLREEATDARRRRAYFWGFGGFCVNGALIVLQLWPPSDVYLAIPKHGVTGDLLTTAVEVLDAALADQRLVSFSCLAALTYFLSPRRLNAYFWMPAAALVLLMNFVYRSRWHVGILYLLWLTLLWVGMSFTEAVSSARSYRARALVLAAAAFLMPIQVCGAYFAARHDYRYNYSAAKHAARFIQTQGLRKKKIFAFGYKSIGVLPYFHDNIFDNSGKKRWPSFWVWSTRNPIRASYFLVQEASRRDALPAGYLPDYILVGSSKANLEEGVLILKKYKLMARFYGDLWWKTDFLEPDVYGCYRRLR